ncbi:MAG: SurA N-terminal domain-containing protein [Bacteriovoracaceae bacterium]|nr:SurA N-terminal domain-containing protein [Bacteriovoracaceae bacterium]
MKSSHSLLSPNPSKPNDKEAHKSRIFVGVILALIGVGFALSTCDRVQLTSQTAIASVDGEDIGYKQYASASKRYEQMLGMGEMTPAQRKQFNFGQKILDELINSKLIIHLAKDQKIWPSPDEVKETIKEQEYFQTDKKFDVNKYKIVLRNAELSPGQYENEMMQDLAQRKMIDLLNVYPVSNKSKNLISQIKKSGIEVNAIRVTHNNMKSGLNISADEIIKFVKDPKNKSVLENSFTRNKYRFETPASKNIKIISVDYTPETLAAAEKESQELKKTLNAANFIKNPKFDKKNGNVGWVSAGRLPPEIEGALFPKDEVNAPLKGSILGPIKTEQSFLLLLVDDEKVETKKTLNDVSHELAEEQIRNLKSKELKALVKETVDNLKELLKAGDIAKIEKIQKQYSFTFEKKSILSPIEKQIGPINLETSQFEKIFTSPKPGDVLTFDNPTETLVVKIENVIPVDMSEKPVTVVADEDPKKEITTPSADDLSQKYVQAQREQILKRLREHARININKDML